MKYAMKLNGKNSIYDKKTKTVVQDNLVPCQICGKSYEFLNYFNHLCYRFTCNSCSAGFDYEHHLHLHNMENHDNIVSAKSISLETLNKKSKTCSAMSQNSKDYNLRLKDSITHNTEDFYLVNKITKKRMQKRLKVDHKSSEEQNHDEVSNASDDKISNMLKKSVKSSTLETNKKETRNTLKKNTSPNDFGSKNVFEKLPCSSTKKETRSTLKNSNPDNLSSKTTTFEKFPCSSTKETRSAQNKNSNQGEVNSKTSNKYVLNSTYKTHLRKCKNFAKQNISKPKDSCVPVSKKSLKKVDTQEVQRHRGKMNEDCSRKKENTKTDMVNVELLIDSLKNDDFGILIVKQFNPDGNFRCAKCGKPFRTVKQASIHYSSCKSSKCKTTLVPVNEVKWICILCHTDFEHNLVLASHRKLCRVFVKKDYDSATESCPNCDFKCFSIHSLRKHKCAEKLEEKINSCSVQLQKLPSFNGTMNSRLILYECALCSKVFTIKYSFDEHMKEHYSNEKSKHLYINLDEHCITTVIKSEIVPSDDDSCGRSKTSSSQKSISPVVNDSMATNSANFQNRNSNSFAMPHLSVNLPTNQPSISQSTTKTSTHSFASTPGTSKNQPSCSTSQAAAKNNLNLFLQQLCKCPNRKTNSEGEMKPCIKCMSKNFDSSAMTSFLKSISFNSHKVKQELSGQEATGENPFDLVNFIFNIPNQNSNKNLEMDNAEASRYLTMQLFDALHHYNLTPPSSVHGITPPTTPDVSAISSPNHTTLPNEEPCSSSDANECYSGSVVPDITQLLDLSHSSIELENYLGEPSGLDVVPPPEPLPEEICSSQEQSCQETPVESHKLTCYWDSKDAQVVDAWAVVSSLDRETVEKYVCSCCMRSWKDEKSLVCHLYTQHKKRRDFFALYAEKKNTKENSA